MPESSTSSGTLPALETRRLGRTDLELSPLGFGGSPLGNVYAQIDPKETVEAAHAAVDAGINFFDVSPYYGLTLAETRLGEALRGVRQRVILATKCGRYGSDTFDFSAARVLASIDESLKRLETDYLDLFQVHDVEFGDLRQIIEETIPALRQIQQQGKARYIGITGYSLPPLIQIAEAAPVDSILTYCRHNLMITDMDRTLLPFTEERGIGLINASPLHMGLLTEQGPPAWHPAPERVRAAGRRVLAVCRTHGYDGPEVALRFALEERAIASTLMGMETRARVAAALKAARLELDPALMGEIRAAMGEDYDYVWPSGRPENHG